MAIYLLLEDGGKITLEDASGFLLLEAQPTEQDSARQLGAGGKRKRRQIVFADGRRVEARTDAEFRRLIGDMLSEAELKEFTKPKAPKKRKPVQKPGSVDPYTVAKAENLMLWSSLMAQLEVMSQEALTQEAIVALARMAIQQMLNDEEAVLMLLVA